jgi:hypothetical protein
MEVWNDEFLKRNLKVNQVIVVRLGLSPYSEWVVIENDVFVPGSGMVVICIPKGKSSKNFEKNFKYSDIVMVF